VPVLASISDELFVNLRDTDWGARAGFDQNRLFIGPGSSWPRAAASTSAA
jgi:hypothetical protein